MKSLKSAARSGAFITGTALCGLVLASCGAGQISQTANQVAAVDGASGGSEDNTIVVRDVTVHVDANGTAGVKFAAINQDPSDATHTLKSVTVDGTAAKLDGSTEIASECSLLGDLPEELDRLPMSKDACISHVPTTIENSGFAYSGTKDVTFTFDSDTTVTVKATVSEPLPEAGTNVRDDAPNPHSHGDAGEHGSSEEGHTH